jgi:peptidoglycan/xylan/chitin deacetylase (PgdA/CDA1 family)
VLVSLTFDDGNEHQYTGFFPILKKYDLRGTFYVVTSWIGQPDILNWNQLTELHEAGNEIGSHTHTHPNLKGLPEEVVDFELKTSFKALNRFDCKTLAYPCGEYNRTVISCAKKYYMAARGYFVDGRCFFKADVTDATYCLKGIPTEEASNSKSVPLLNLPLHDFSKEIIKLTNGGDNDWAIFVFHGQKITTKVVLRTIKRIVNSGRVLSVHQVTHSLKYGASSGNSLAKFHWLCDYISKAENLDVVTISEGVQKLSTAV